MAARAVDTWANHRPPDPSEPAAQPAPPHEPTRTEPPRPRLLMSETVLSAEDPTARMMARTLELLTSLVPVTAAMFHSIDGPHGRQSNGPLLTKVSQQTARALRTADPDQRVNEYFTRYHKLDPFDPRYHAHRKSPIVSVADLGGIKSFLGTPWAAEYLASWGVAVETVMFLRDHGRITAGISLTRPRGAPELTRQELVLLHRCHPVIEEAWTLAHRGAAPLEHPEPLRTSGLTPRQIEIAHLAAAGWSNDEIARALIISPNTVSTHLKRAYARLGVHTRLQLARILGPDDQSHPPRPPRASH